LIKKYPYITEATGIFEGETKHPVKDSQGQYKEVTIFPVYYIIFLMPLNVHPSQSFGLRAVH